jgi:hypothetical protein
MARRRRTSAQVAADNIAIASGEIDVFADGDKFYDREGLLRASNEVARLALEASAKGTISRIEGLQLRLDAVQRVGAIALDRRDSTLAATMITSQEDLQGLLDVLQPSTEAVLAPADTSAARTGAAKSES